MDQERFLRVKELFRDAMALPTTARDEWLDRECALDAGMRAEVEDLLKHAASAQAGFLDALAATDAVPAHTPFSVPGFRILERIAAGAAGVVYRAEQLTPQREVALKVLRLDTLAPGQVARFRREAEILGSLNHPGIAHVFSAGVIEDESLPLPWLAMEFVRGVTLDEYVAARKPDTRAILALFRAVCDAVDHAHQRGIVHRDLKPSNVLVQDDGRPRVVDFGVARVLEGGDLGGTAHTHPGMLVGTIAYMAPEQARGEHDALDVRADVYALGVLLFELLTGRLPLELDDVDLLEAVHRVTTVEPVRLRQVRPELPQDLETILVKALEKEPARRYSSAGQLSQDIANLVAERPIMARRPTVIYQAARFVRRNRAFTIGAATVIAALTLGLGLALASLRSTREQRAITSENLEFIAGQMVALAPQLGFGEAQRGDLMQVAERIVRQLVVDPGNRSLRASLAQTLYELASLDQTREDVAGLQQHADAARAIRAELVREDPGDLVSWTHLSQLYAKLGEAARDSGDPAGRDMWFTRALENDERLVREHPWDLELEEDLGWSLARVAAVLQQRGEHAEADKLAQRRLADAQRIVEREAGFWKYVFNLSDAHYALANMRESAGRTDLALAHAHECVRLARRVLELEPARRDLVFWLASACRQATRIATRQGEHERAHEYADEAIELAEELVLADPRRQAHIDLLKNAALEPLQLMPPENRADFAHRAAITLRRVAAHLKRTGANANANTLQDVAKELEQNQ